MTSLTQNGSRRRRNWILTAAILVLGFTMLQVFGQQPPPAGAPAAGQPDPSEHLFKLGFKFQGAATCANAQCHGAPAGTPPAAGGKYINPSYTQWAAEATPDAPADPHHTSFRTLRKPASKAIAQKMGIAEPTSDARCLACHTLNAPATMREPALTITEGVTCNACHGPSGGKADPKNLAAAPGPDSWIVQHQTAGWAKQQRTAYAGKHEELLKKTGLYDTHVLVERSQQCVSCHLSINPQMVAAGHPQPMFEMNWFSLVYPNRHWNDPTDKYFGAKLWGAGQAAALQAALRQLAERADAKSGAGPAEIASAFNQAQAHYLVFAPAFSVGGLPAAEIAPVAAQMTALDAAMKDPAKRADVAKAAAAGADAAAKLTASVDKWEPTKDGVMKIIAAECAQPALAGLGGGFGIEQQRDAIFGLYKAFADSADKTADAQGNVDFIGEKLFPLEGNAPVNASKIPAAKHTAAVAEVKAKLKV
jgi:hypothetical protein